MQLPAAFAPALPTIGGILAAMAVVAAVEALIPLHARGRWARAHLAPNLALTAITFATNSFLNAALLAGLFWLEQRGFGLLNALALPPLAAGALAVVLLDFSFYLAHVGMHRIPSWWRVHRVHHADPFVDVTTTIRQHPLEGLIRYAFMGAFAFALVPTPAAFGVYRLWVALSGLLEHANLRCPLRLDRALSLVATWPHMHKIHHSRVAAQTDSNYGNLFPWWDRLFGTFTPSREGVAIDYGLEGFDDAAAQTTRGLLRSPWRDHSPASSSSPAVSASSGMPRPESAESRPALA
jgi:sterol desaturase/sphingolipid hydroxylase (fatty acid hydroxylase superfamily)